MEKQGKKLVCIYFEGTAGAAVDRVGNTGCPLWWVEDQPCYCAHTRAHTISPTSMAVLQLRTHRFMMRLRLLPQQRIKLHLSNWKKNETHMRSKNTANPRNSVEVPDRKSQFRQVCVCVCASSFDSRTQCI